MKVLRWIWLGMALAAPLNAQGYRLRLDTRVHSVDFRGVQLDSVLRSATVPDSIGGLYTPDGYAVHCEPGDTYCTFFREGPQWTA